MAVTDNYATLGEYKARVDHGGSGDDATITAQLSMVSRFIERKCERFFNQDAAVVTRVYDGGTSIIQRLDDHYVIWNPNAKTRLLLPDDIATTTGLVVKVDLDGDYIAETTLTLDTDFWVGEPNAALGPEPRPYTWLEVIPTSGKLFTWPAQRRGLAVTAKWGWPAVPGPIKEATVMLVRELRDLQQSGFTLTVENIDATIAISPRGPAILKEILANYGRQRRMFA